MPNTLDAAEMLRAAQTETGLSDWGSYEEWGGDFRPAYDAFIGALNTEARLSADGAYFTRNRIMDLLRGRLQMVEDRKRIPGIKEEVIKEPVFVIGLPRSGTTFMSNLLAQDPENRSTQSWELRLPSPPPETATYGSDPRIAEMQEIFQRVGMLDQAVQEVHPTGAQRYTECVFIHSYAFQSAEFIAHWHVPSFVDWVYHASNFRDVYRFQHSMLQHLQHRCPGVRWVLKSPAHMPYLSELLDVFPDARFVNCLRDPAKVVSSLSNTLARMRSRFSEQLPEPADSAREELLINAYLTDKALDFFDAHPEFEERCFNAHYLEVQKDPMAVVRQIYDKFGIPMTSERDEVMCAWLAKDRAKHKAVGTHSHSLDDYRIDYETIDKHYSRWIERFQIELDRPVVS